MLRIDLVVNNLLASAMAYGEIRIQSDGSPWRPLIHCRDIARAFAAFARAPREAVHDQAINVGGNRENYQVRDVGDQVQRLIPTARVVYTGEVGADPGTTGSISTNSPGSCLTSGSSIIWSAAWKSSTARWSTMALARKTLRAISSSGFVRSRADSTASATETRSIAYVDNIIIS